MQIAQHKSNSISYTVKEPFILESVNTLQDLRIHYTTHGELNPAKSNVVWVFHALTANSDPVEWWPGLVGEGHLINPEQYFIVCANMLGSCYGSTEPDSFDFPLITVKDMVKAHQLLKEHLGIDRIKIGIGGSMGGQQLLEWAVWEPELFETIIPVATNAKHSAWGIAFNEAQRMAIQGDPENGIETARAIGMLSYRHYETFNKTQSDNDHRIDGYSASSYQLYQGEKLAKRFTPYSYYYLSKAMDSHNVGRHFEGIEQALSRIQSKAIVIGIETDILFPLSEQKSIQESIDNASFHPIHSLYGHDGFLIETDQISQIIEQELK